MEIASPGLRRGRNDRKIGGLTHSPDCPASRQTAVHAGNFVLFGRMAVPPKEFAMRRHVLLAAIGLLAAGIVAPATGQTRSAPATLTRSSSR